MSEDLTKRAATFANVVLLGAISFLTLLIIYEIIDYRARLRGVSEFLYYYALPAFALALLIPSLRLRQNLKVNLALLLVSTAFTVYALEGFITVVAAASERERTMNSGKAGKPSEGSVILETIEQYERQGLEALPSAHYFARFERWGVSTACNDGLFALGGVANVTTVFCAEGTEDGAAVVYESDEHGFHNPRGLYSAEGLAVAVVGDSFAQGFCVKSEENAAALIRQTYTRTLNVGLNGIGPLGMLAVFREYVQPLEPDVVLWFYFEGNDLANMSVEKGCTPLLKYLDEGYSQALLSRQEEIDRGLRAFIAAERQNASQEQKNPETRHPAINYALLVRLRGLARSRLERLVQSRLERRHYGQDEVGLDLFRDILLSARDTTTSWGGQLYFVYLPGLRRFIEPELADPHREQVLRLVGDLRIPVIDVHEAFAAHEDPLALFPVRVPYHYNAAGYEVVADHILSFIEERK